MKKLNILLIEDNEDDVFLLKELVAESESYSRQIRFSQARRLEEGLSLLDEKNFDAVVLDLSLPDSRGLETLARFETKFQAIPVPDRVS